MNKKAARPSAVRLRVALATPGPLLLLVASLVCSPTVAADELVLLLDRWSNGVAGDVANSKAPQPRLAVPRGLPSALRLPVETATDGSLKISLHQQIVDSSVTTSDLPPVARLRVLSPSVGNVIEGSRGKVGVGMDATLAFDDLAKGTSRIFDVKLGGEAEAGAAYGGEFPIYIEGWRRKEDGKPVEHRTKENRSFWGTLSGRFEP